MGKRLLLALASAALALAPAATAADFQAAGAKQKRAAKQKRLVKKARVRAFRSCAQLARYGRRHVRRGPGAGPQPFVGLPPAPMPLGRDMLPGVAPAPQAEQLNSKTNVQEAGVGEPDVVKAQGSTIFAVAQNKVHAVDASGAAPRLLGSLPVEGFGHELLLRRDTLLVFSQVYPDQPVPLPGPRSALGFAPLQSATLITQVDVSNPAALRLVKTQEVEGSFVSARKNGASVRAVISAPPPALYEPQLRPGVGGWLPETVIEDPATGARSERRLARCRSVRRPAAFFSGLELLTVLTIDMDRGLPAVDADALMTGGEVVYASRRSLYVATQRWTPEPGSPGDEPPKSFTAVHKFDISERGKTSYRASGAVPGYLLNQFSLSEHEGVLRAASTANPTWWNGAQRDEGQSYVTTLDERPAGLVQLGQVGGLGRGERIFAVRFIGDTGYVVTFRQVDPLYTLDLSKPAEPRVVGELKIAGYSAYLHPLAGDLLLGVGQDATEEGRLKGTQLSLFDVSDLARPRRLHQLALGSSSSEAEYDHHAFLWWPPAKLAVIPLQSTAFAGAAGFNVARASGISEAGRASHDEYPVRRALVVGGRLYTLSDKGLEANSLETLAEQAFLPLG